MLDFMHVLCRDAKSSKGKEAETEVYPRFIVKKTKDLMIRGGDFYAIWDETKGLWSTDEYDAVTLIDNDIRKWAEEHDMSDAHLMLMQNADSGVIDRWHKYCQKQLRDSYHQLDDRVIFSDTEVTKETYASKRLSYPLVPCDTPAYDQLMSTLYSPEERRKIEWAIGAIVTGDSTWIQKFLVLYGAAGTGKSTVLNIIQQLFDGYYSTFDSEALGSASNVFALESFKSNPLVAIQHDGNLARIETNTRINSLVAHEEMAVNEKFRSIYTQRFRSFLFMGTNKPVKITDAKSGLIRRIIDVSPTGDKIPFQTYNKLIKKVKFELGGIACHCRDVYLSDPEFYDDYIPLRMLEGTNDFYNFVLDSWDIFADNDETTLRGAWELYKAYCDDAKVAYPYPRRVFKEELKNYFKEFHDRGMTADGVRVRNWYKGFNPPRNDEEEPPIESKSWLIFDGDGSVFDSACKDCKAQYANKHGVPNLPWDKSDTLLSDISTNKLHYVLLPKNHIVIDFDLKDETGNKNLDICEKAASAWPPTYAEVSKSGNGIHLHYIYDGDTDSLARVYSEGIEIKVFSGKSSLRRIGTKTNSLPIAHISSGLPTVEKKGGTMLEDQTIKNERQLRALIAKNLNKEIHAYTKPSMDFIKKLLDEAYESGIHYDVSDMADAVYIFAMNSSNNSRYCLDLFRQMRWRSEEITRDIPTGDDAPLVFFDCEVYPNFFCVVLKPAGEGQKFIRLVDPSPAEIEGITKFKLVGFNNLSYDNQILWARMMGYSNEQLYNLSRRIIDQKRPVFAESKNLSYTDVYDFCSKKQSLKKWEIELGIHHQEMGIPWDQPVPDDKKKLVVEYCQNDVAATEAVFNARKADFDARLMIADLAGMTPNDRTNAISCRLVFEGDRHPELNWYDLSTEFPGYTWEKGADGKMHNMYRGVDLGFGGYVYAEKGMWYDVISEDVAGMHPATIIKTRYFGKRTKNFEDLYKTRIDIKHKNYAAARKRFSGKLAKYLTDESQANALAYALKIVLNSMYGQTCAPYENPCKDKRNVNNFVALRGALFMKTLQDEVTARGFKVVHVKTDSLKIANATEDICQFCVDFGRKYGYDFEVEAIYDRMCLVNDAAYIAHEADNSPHKPGQWSPKATQFQVSYVFKTLFSKEPITFEDLCVTQSTKDALYLDFNEGLPDVEPLEKKLAQLRKARRKPEDLAKFGKRYFKTDELVSDETLNDLEQELVDEIAKGHNYIFVGRVGQFVPVKDGTGGGLLYRGKDGKYSYAAGARGYRWKESEIVRNLGLESTINYGYGNALVNDAVATIEQFGDFGMFYDGIKIPF